MTISKGGKKIPISKILERENQKSISSQVYECVWRDRDCLA
jgi:hypothetical protein